MEVSVIATGKLLWEVKGGGQGQAISKAEVTQAADAILQPLMDLLDGMHLPSIHIIVIYIHQGIFALKNPVAFKFTFLFMPYLNILIIISPL